MSHITSEDRDLLIDLESGRITSEEGTNQSSILGNRQAKKLLKSYASGLLAFNGSAGIESHVNSYNNLGEPGEVATRNMQVFVGKNSGREESVEHMALDEKQHVKEKHKKASYKKATKPPRPPKGPSLDAADLKLVKEISTISMKRRARNERLKSLRKMKDAKSSLSSSLLSNSSLSATVISILFFLVILFQGFCSKGSSGVSFQGSPQPEVTTNSLISVQFYNNPPAEDDSGIGSNSRNSVEQAFGSKFRFRE